MDLVADVLQQADVKKLKLATRKLVGTEDRAIAKGPTTDFQAVSAVHNRKNAQSVARLEFKKDQSRVPVNGQDGPAPAAPSREAQKNEAMRGLETVLATKMVEAMMPKDQSELYGEGTAGEIWRGFHIDTMGKALASQRLFSTSGNEVVNATEDADGKGRPKPIVPFAG
jgi:hypothetical protein